LVVPLAAPLFPEEIALFHMALASVITVMMLLIYMVRKWFHARTDADEAQAEYMKVYSWDKEVPVKPLDPMDELPMGDKGYYFDSWEDKDVKVEHKEYVAKKGGETITIPVKEVEVKEGTEARDRAIETRGRKEARDEKTGKDKVKRKKERMRLGEGGG